MKKILVMVGLLCLAAFAYFMWQSSHTAPSSQWSGILSKYRNDSRVQQLVFVQALKGSQARVIVYQKDESEHNAWTSVLDCDGFIGWNGLGKQKEGDGKTPTGDFGITTAFGIKKNPGTKMPYLDVTESMYCCGEKEFYNKIIDNATMKHKCGENSEHMISYSPQYNYGFAIDYNKDGAFGKGSAIFFHCFGPNDYTAGCVSVAEENMKTILKYCDGNARICIYPKVN